MVKLVVVAGVSGSGKSRLAVQLAKRFNGEIISADAYQVYKGMDIGTNKISITKMGGVTHHLIDCAAVNEEWDVSIFQTKARQIIDELAKKGKLPIVCGGTGFYINALVKNYVFLPLSKRNDYTPFTNEQLWDTLTELDAAEAERIPVNNRRRLEKALDFIKGHHLKKSEHDQRSKAFVYDPLIIFLDPPKEQIVPLIKERTQKMLEEGWVEEAKALQKKFPAFSKSVAIKAIGYEQALDGNPDAEAISQQIIYYTRKQRTWFVNKHKDRTLIFKEVYTPEVFKKAAEAVDRFLVQPTIGAHAP